MSFTLRGCIAAAAFASFSAPAIADKYFAVTPSGAAETIFVEQPQAVVGKISSKCIDVKWKVVSSTGSEVVCEAPLNMGQSIVGQMLMGNSYSTPPRRFFRFNVAEVNGVSRVQASGWMELQMAFGQTKRNEFTGPGFHNGAIDFMTSAGGKLPVGTSFPNHAMLGFDEEWVAVGKNQSPRILKVRPDTAAEKAGLRVGDTITRIAGKGLKSRNDALDAMAKAAERPTFEVEYLRGGQAKKVTLERAYRPAWSEAVVPVAATGVPAPALSVADELAKLAKLKADGLLTDAEFEAQKQKLLAR